MMAERRPGEYSGAAASHDGGGRQVSDGGDEEAKRVERLRLDTLREDRIMKVMIVRNESPGGFVEWIDR